jgi:hypothetical protein
VPRVSSIAYFESGWSFGFNLMLTPLARLRLILSVDAGGGAALDTAEEDADEGGRLLEKEGGAVEDVADEGGMLLLESEGGILLDMIEGTANEKGQLLTTFVTVTMTASAKTTDGASDSGMATAASRHLVSLMLLRSDVSC